jgi:integrase
MFDPSKLTVGEVLVRWLEDAARPRIEASTFEFYSLVVHQRLIPALGGIRLANLHPLHTHKVLAQALEQAVLWRLIPRNPARDVRPPRPERTPMVTLDARELMILFKCARGTRLFVALVITGTMGLRLGEVLAVRWRDMDSPHQKCDLRHRAGFRSTPASSHQGAGQSLSSLN